MDSLKKENLKVSLLKERKYLYEDSGLACNMSDFNMINYKEKWDII